MTNNKGITMISLIIYIIVITFILSGLTAITTSFYKNVNEVDKGSESAVSFSRFNMYFLNDIKEEEAEISDVTPDGKSIAIGFKRDGQTNVATYRLSGNSIYRNNVKICSKVKDFKVDASPGKESKIITITMNISDYEKTTTYNVEPKIIIKDTQTGL